MLTQQDLTAIGTLIDQKLQPLKSDIEVLNAKFDGLDDRVGGIDLNIKEIKIDVKKIKKDVRASAYFLDQEENHLDLPHSS